VWYTRHLSWQKAPRRKRKPTRANSTCNWRTCPICFDINIGKGERNKVEVGTVGRGETGEGNSGARVEREGSDKSIEGEGDVLFWGVSKYGVIKRHQLGGPPQS